MEILKGNRLTIFENKIVVDKNLPKWRRAEAGLNKTNIEDNPKETTKKKKKSKKTKKNN